MPSCSPSQCCTSVRRAPASASAANLRPHREQALCGSGPVRGGRRAACRRDGGSGLERRTAHSRSVWAWCAAGGRRPAGPVWRANSRKPQDGERCAERAMHPDPHTEGTHWKTPRPPCRLAAPQAPSPTSPDLPAPACGKLARSRSATYLLAATFNRLNKYVFVLNHVTTRYHVTTHSKFWLCTTNRHSRNNASI